MNNVWILMPLYIAFCGVAKTVFSNRSYFRHASKSVIPNSILEMRKHKNVAITKTSGKLDFKHGQTIPTGGLHPGSSRPIILVQVPSEGYVVELLERILKRGIEMTKKVKEESEQVKPKKQSEQQPARKSEQQPASKSEQQPGTKSEQPPASKSEQQPGTKSEQQPGTKSEQQPATKSEQKPEKPIEESAREWLQKKHFNEFLEKQKALQLFKDTTGKEPSSTSESNRRPYYRGNNRGYNRGYDRGGPDRRPYNRGHERGGYNRGGYDRFGPYNQRRPQWRPRPEVDTRSPAEKRIDDEQEAGQIEQPKLLGHKTLEELEAIHENERVNYATLKPYEGGEPDGDVVWMEWKDDEPVEDLQDMTDRFSKEKKRKIAEILSRKGNQEPSEPTAWEIRPEDLMPYETEKEVSKLKDFMHEHDKVIEEKIKLKEFKEPHVRHTPEERQRLLTEYAKDVAVTKRYHDHLWKRQQLGLREELYRKRQGDGPPNPLRRGEYSEDPKTKVDVLEYWSNANRPKSEKDTRSVTDWMLKQGYKNVSPYQRFRKRRRALIKPKHGIPKGYVKYRLPEVIRNRKFVVEEPKITQAELEKSDEYQLEKIDHEKFAGKVMQNLENKYRDQWKQQEEWMLEGIPRPYKRGFWKKPKQWHPAPFTP